MTRERQQREEELEWARRFFLYHFDQEPEFEDLPTNSRPDVCVRFNEKRIGIELTRAIDDSCASRDKFRERFLKAAREAQMRLNGPHGRITVTFRRGFDPTAYSYKYLGTELGQIVADQWAKLDGMIDISAALMSPALRDLVTDVRAFVQNGATSTDWIPAAAATVQPIDAQSLQEIINKKTAKLSAYRTPGFDEVWLLIYARFGRTAEFFDEFAGFDPCTLQSDFDRTFFYDFWRCYELGTGP